MNYGSRRPLYGRHDELTKAVEHGNPSYESFRPNVVHPVQYREMEDRAGVSAESRVRRYPDGKIDLEWTAHQIIDAIHKAEYNGILLPIEAALLTVVFPINFPKMEPQQAEILTQLSSTEKKALSTYVEAHLRAEDSWNSGRGGGSVPGKLRTNAGG